jgi:methyltransferase (TIGR00027 family)
MDNTKQAIAATGLLVAAMRAEESARDDALFSDPFAERLAGEDGRRLLAEAAADTGQPSAPIVVRTKFLDEALLRAQADGVSQVVILAAGMDARAFRLPWQRGTTVFEIDQPHMITAKDERLAGERPRCQRVAVGVDLADDWPKVLQSQGFTSSSRTVWLIEGLLQYIDASDVDGLFARVDALSARVLCCCTTSSARRCWTHRCYNRPWSSWQSWARRGSLAATPRPHSSSTVAGPPP